MIIAGRHQVGDVGVSGRRDHYPFVPTVMHTENTFGASSVEDHPESARTKMMLWLPAWAEASFMPRLGDNLIGEASLGGVSFTYFSGNVDALKAGRMRGKTTPSVVRLEAPTVQVKDYNSEDNTSTIKNVGLIERRGNVTTISIGPRDSESPKDGYGLREVIITWTAASANVYRNHVLVLGGPTNAAPLDLSAPSETAPLFTPTVQNPVVSLTGSAEAVQNNKTVYRLVTTSTTVAVKHTFSVSPRGRDRVIRVVDPAIVDVSGSRNVKGRFVQVDASDFLAPAGRMRIGDKPFPKEEPHSRWNKVRNLLRENDMPIVASDTLVASKKLQAGVTTYAILEKPGGTSPLVKPLDIDSRSALDVLQRTSLAAGGAVVISTQNGLGFQLRATPFRTLKATNGVVSFIDGPTVTRLPSRVVEEVPRTLSTQSIINQVEWDVAQPDGAGGVTETSEIYSDTESVARSGPAPLKLQSDAYRDAPNMNVVLAYRASNLLRSEAVWTFDSPVTITDDTQARNLAWALNPKTRHGHAVLIQGYRPSDVGEEWRVRGGSFTVGEEDSISLELDPAEWLPDLGVSYLDMSGMPGVTFGGMGSITFNDMMEVDL